jgi:S-adenosylmethionine synthetase
MVEDYGTSKVDNKKLVEAVRKVWDLRPAAIIKQFDLLKPKYARTAAYGHFGRNEDSFTWEKSDKIEALRELV